MSIFIKQKTIKFRDRTGNYHSANSVAERSSEESIALINEAAEKSKKELEAIKLSKFYPLMGKTVCFIGDSRTWYDGKNYVDTAKDGIAGTPCKGYQQTVKEYTGCKVVTLGYNGGNSAYIASRVKNYDFSNIDYVVLDGGVNDYIVGGVAPGELTPIDKVYSIENNDYDISYTITLNKIITTSGIASPTGCAYATANIEPGSVVYLGRASENYSVEKDAVMIMKEDGTYRTVALTELEKVQDADGLQMLKIITGSDEVAIKFNVKLDTYDDTNGIRLTYQIGNTIAKINYTMAENRKITTSGVYAATGCILAMAKVNPGSVVYLGRESGNYSVEDDAVKTYKSSGGISRTIALTELEKVQDADGLQLLKINIEDDEDEIDFNVKQDAYDDKNGIRLFYNTGEVVKSPDVLSITTTTGLYCNSKNLLTEHETSVIGTVNIENISNIYIRRASENYDVKDDCVVVTNTSGNQSAIPLSSIHKITDEDGHVWLKVKPPVDSATLTFTIKLSNVYDDRDNVYVRTNISGIVSNLCASTAYGAWQTIVEHIIKSNPNAKIIMNTIFPCWDENGSLPLIHSEIKRNVAKEYNIPICDLEKISGINSRNNDEYYCDDLNKTPQWHLHLNNKGNVKIGIIIANFISGY